MARVGRVCVVTHHLISPGVFYFWILQNIVSPNSRVENYFLLGRDHRVCNLKRTSVRPTTSLNSAQHFRQLSMLVLLQHNIYKYYPVLL